MKCLFKAKRLCNLKTITIILSILIMYNFLLYILFNRRSKESRVVLENVVLHLDLKGAPPKLSYLRNTFLPLIKNLGVTGLLIEFEDMYPYSGKLVDLRSKYAYKAYSMLSFIKYARSEGFEIIPLIQTFGHMEFVLKLKKYKKLRENPRRADSICPSQNESYVLIRDMIKQVLRYIKPLRYLHIGCDEVFNLNICRSCLHRQLNNITLFTDHVRNVRDIVKSLSPDTKVLIWDDMLRDRKLFKVKNNVLENKVELVYWNYIHNVTQDQTNLYLYHRHFKNIWLASAFKGADGRMEIFPNLHYRFQNHVSLLNLVRNYRFAHERDVYAFAGIILTGWSRYNHIAPLCELIVTAVPSLILNLIVIKRYKQGITCCEHDDENDYFTKHIEEDLRETLKCKNKIENVNHIIYNCTFNGYKLSQELKKYELCIKQFELHYYDYQLPYIEYYSKINSTILSIMYETQEWCTLLLDCIVESEKKISKEMSRYYEPNVIEEYVNSRSYHAKKKLQETLSIIREHLLDT